MSATGLISALGGAVGKVEDEGEDFESPAYAIAKKEERESKEKSATGNRPPGIRTSKGKRIKSEQCEAGFENASRNAMMNESGEPVSGGASTPQ